MTTPTGRVQWLEAARAVLVRAGARPDVDPQVALRTEPAAGLTVEALYAADNAAEPVPIMGRRGEWDVRQRFGPDDDAARLNREVLADLSGGVTSVWLCGVPADAVAPALDGVLLDVAGLAFDGDPAVLDACWRLADDTSTLSGSLGVDPLAVSRRSGQPLDPGIAVTWAKWCAAHAPRMRSVVVDANALHVDGADAVAQLTWSLVAGVHYLRALTDAGLSAAQAVGQLEVRWAVTDDQFLSLAMLRAARRMWERVAELCGADTAVVHHAVTSPLMLTQRDPWTNLLRTTIATLAAATGGADAITVLPFDHTLGRPDALARRVARNTHHVLVSESSLGRVDDPAAGSWYVETLTDQLARAAWDRFTAVERGGGLAAALADGTLEAELAAGRRDTAERIARRRQPVVGATRFAVADEVRLGRPGHPAADTAGRWSAPFERLRDRADSLTSRPVVALVGDERRDADRIAFARDLFAAGGFDTVILDTVILDAASLDVATRDTAGHDLVCVCTEEPQDIPGTRRSWHVGTDGLREGIDVLAVLTDAWAALDEAAPEQETVTR